MEIYPRPNIATPPKSKCAIDLDVWKPQESESSMLLKELLDNYVGTLKMCGDEEEAADALGLYKKVLLCDDLAEIKDNIQAFALDCYRSVGGEIDKYFGADSQFTSMIRLTLGLR